MREKQESQAAAEPVRADGLGYLDAVAAVGNVSHGAIDRLRALSQRQVEQA
jgi:hypothetical protein